MHPLEAKRRARLVSSAGAGRRVDTRSRRGRGAPNSSSFAMSSTLLGESQHSAATVGASERRPHACRCLLLALFCRRETPPTPHDTQPLRRPFLACSKTEKHTRNTQPQQRRLIITQREPLLCPQPSISTASRFEFTGRMEYMPRTAHAHTLSPTPTPTAIQAARASARSTPYALPTPPAVQHFAWLFHYTSLISPPRRTTSIRAVEDDGRDIVSFVHKEAARQVLAAPLGHHERCVLNQVEELRAVPRA
jgi:hypothetical protein